MPGPCFFNVVALIFFYDSDVYSVTLESCWKAGVAIKTWKMKKGNNQYLWLKPEVSEFTYFTMHATSLYLFPA